MKRERCSKGKTVASGSIQPDAVDPNVLLVNKKQSDEGGGADDPLRHCGAGRPFSGETRRAKQLPRQWKKHLKKHQLQTKQNLLTME